MEKVKVGIIGTGNIGTDLLMKVIKSKYLECGIFTGRNPDSEGLNRAKKMGISTSIESIKYIQDKPDCCQIVFDATSAKVHLYNAPILRELNKYTIDLTPAHIGDFCVPTENLEKALQQDNVNMITCGGQATVPIACALSRVQKDISYLEIVATISSRSAGKGTRKNIDEFTQATRDALAQFSGIQKTKAIINLNPAEPPIVMHNTVYALVQDPNMEVITREIRKTEKIIQEYVPGYRVVLGPLYENGRIVVSVEVIGSGDFLPKYAGNLDIITCSAIKVAEEYAKRRCM